MPLTRILTSRWRSRKDGTSPTAMRRTVTTSSRRPDRSLSPATSSTKPPSRSGPDSAIRNPDLADEWYLPWDNPGERDDRWGGLAPPRRLHLRALHRLRPVSIRNLRERRDHAALLGSFRAEFWKRRPLSARSRTVVRLEDRQVLGRRGGWRQFRGRNRRDHRTG